MAKKHEEKKVHGVEEHRPWELEVQTEGLDDLQGERLEQKAEKKSTHKHVKA